MSLGPSNPPRTATLATLLIYVGVTLFVLLFAVSARSLWIDEAWTAHFARLPALKLWWSELVAERETNLQMPLYTLWIWGCEKLVGSSEFTLRFLNFCWFIPALAVMGRAFKGRAVALAAFLVAALSPFAWYYLGEARSYTMQMSLAIIVYAAMIRLIEGALPDPATERKWVFVFAAAMVMVAGSSLLAMYLAVIPLLVMLASLPTQRLLALLKEHTAVWVVMFALLAVWGVFYIWTLQLGARATGIAGTDWRNPLFVAYELAGFSGLGPGRSAIRDGGLGAFKPFAGWLVLYGMCVAVLLGGALLSLRRWGWRKVFLVSMAVLVPTIVLFVASQMKHFRILGRHFAVLFPVIWILLSFGMVQVWRRSTAGRFVAILFLTLSAGSALSLRFAARHEKDNYRAVAAVARAELARGKVVWWSGDAKAANYYAVPLSDPGPSRGAAMVLNATPQDLLHQPRPDWVVCSRPDAYDAHGTLARWLQEQHYKMFTNVSGITVWAAP